MSQGPETRGWIASGTGNDERPVVQRGYKKAHSIKAIDQSGHSSSIIRHQLQTIFSLKIIFFKYSNLIWSLSEKESKENTPIYEVCIISYQN